MACSLLKILDQSQQDQLFLFFNMQAQAGRDETTADLVIAQEVEREGKGGTLVKNQMVMRQPKCIIELLVVVILVIGMDGHQGIAQQLADLHLLGKTQTGRCPTRIQPGGVLEDAFYSFAFP